MDAAPLRRYTAFISYRHADNTQEGRRWAEWLHQSLETYEVPRDLVGRPNGAGASVPPTLYPIFRDEAELPANAELSQPIRRALENSVTLIVLCSPRACESRFVAEEIRCFKELGKSDRILALILDGEPNVADPGKAGAGFNAAQECFPDALRFGVPGRDGAIDWTIRSEPIAADVRPDGVPGEGFTTAAAYGRALEGSQKFSAGEIERRVQAYEQRLDLAKLKIIAGILGVALGELTQRDKAYQLEKERRRVRIFRRVAAGFVLLAILALAGAGIAWWQRGRAQRESTRAEAARASQAEALAGAYYDRALVLIEDDHLADALPYVAASLRLIPEQVLASRLAGALLLHPKLRVPSSRPIEGERHWSVKFQPDRRRAIINWINAPPEWIDVEHGRSLGSVTLGGPGASSISASFNTRGEAALLDAQTAQVWPAGGLPGGPPEHVHFMGLALGEIAITDGGHHLLFRVKDRSVATIMSRLTGTDPRGSVRLIDRTNGRARDLKVHEGTVRDVAAVPGSDDFVTIGEDRRLRHWRPGSETPLGDYLSDRTLRALAVSPDGQWVAAGGDNGRVTLVHLASKTVQPTDLYSPRRDVRCLAFSPDSARLAVGFDGEDGSRRGSIQLWSVATGGPVGPSATTADWVAHVAFDDAGERLAYLCTEGEAGILDAATGAPLAAWHAGTQANALAFAPGGATVAVAADDRSLRFYPAAAETPAEIRVALPDLVRRLAVDAAGEWAVAALGSARDRHVWISLRDGRPAGSVFPHPGAAIQRIHLLPSGSGWAALLIFDNGAMEISAPDGTVLARQEANGGFADAIQKFVLGQDMGTEFPISFSGSDDCDFAPGLGQFIRGGGIYQTEALRQVAARLNAGELEVDSPTGSQQVAETMLKALSGELTATEPLTGRVLWTLKMPHGIVRPCLSRDGRTLVALNSANAAIVAWRRSGEDTPFVPLALPATLGKSSAHSNPIDSVSGLALSSDGRWLAAQAAETRVYDLQANPPVLRPLARGLVTHSVMFAPAGPVVALDLKTNEYSGAVQLWNVETGEPASPLFTHGDTINTIRFSPDGRLLLTASDDNTARVWDVAKGRLAVPAIRLKADVNAAEFLPDGRGLVLGGDDRHLTIVPLPPPEPAPAWTAPVLEALGGARIDESGHPRAVSLAGVFDALPPPDVNAAGFWPQLAAWLQRGSADAAAPGLPSHRAASLQMSRAADAWQTGQRALALVLLRETLRHHPAQPAPPELAALTQSLGQPEPAALTFDLPGSRPAGSVLEGPAGMRFRWCPPGRFVMGSPAGKIGKNHFEPEHRVLLTEGFWIGETEVTQAQWEAIMGRPALDHAIERLGDPESKFQRTAGGGTITCLQAYGLKDAAQLRDWPSWFQPACPMILVTAADAEAFAAKLGERFAAEPPASLEGAWRAVLPTEAQWEYACRAGTTGRTYAVGPVEVLGKNNAPALSPLAWYGGNSSEGIIGHGFNSKNWPEREQPGDIAGIHPAGLKLANPWGLRDMLGNVQEWCADTWERYPAHGAVDPLARGGSERVVRGGAINTAAAGISASARSGEAANWRSLTIGFRVVLVPGVSPSP